MEGAVLQLQYSIVSTRAGRIYSYRQPVDGDGDRDRDLVFHNCNKTQSHGSAIYCTRASTKIYNNKKLASRLFS